MVSLAVRGNGGKGGVGSRPEGQVGEGGVDWWWRGGRGKGVMWVVPGYGGGRGGC